MNEDGINKRVIPGTIGIATRELTPLLMKWREEHRGVPWSVLLRRALNKELKPYAGKKFAHLVSEAA